MSNNIAQDNIVSTEQRYKNARRILEAAILEEARRKEAERLSLRPTSIWPAGTFNTEDIPQRPDNWLYNTLSDPKLNRGLETIAGNAADIILGIESGNPLVDLGTSNIPGVGAASILAAGGMPGLVDAVGIGELKNMKRIPKYTYEFVKDFFGDKGLQNLDNALTKYPKAGKPSVNDAVYILKTGLGGETVPAKAAYSSNVSEDLAPIMGYDSGEAMMNMLRNRYNDIMSGDREDSKEWAKIAYNRIQNTVESGDSKGALAALTAFYDVYRNFYDPYGPVPNNLVKERIKNINKYVLGFGNLLSTDKQLGSRFSDKQLERIRLLKELDESPMQDWETIAMKQERKDARDLEKQARKQSKDTKSEQPKQEQPIQVEVKPEVKETPKGGPNKWKENGWNPNIRGDVFYGRFGGNLSDESKRDAFVMDSLANYWARQIVGEGKEGKLSEAEIFNAKDRADARHKRSNYDEVSQGFYNDIKKNIETGNMPGKSVMFGPKYKRNVRTYRDTPTLILKPEEKPKYYDDIRIWADEQDGPDIYEILFRPEVDKRLNKLNEAYWLYNNSKR